MTRTAWHPLTLTAVTPMFLGKFTEAPTQPSGMPFPVPSLRGALGYWLRALVGAHIGDDLRQLAEAETAVFGGARSARSGGPSTIWLRGSKPVRVSEFRLKPDNNKGKPDNNKDRIAYLMGPGLSGANPPARCVETAKTISLEVRNTGSSVHADLFLSALWALRTFGGIGARTRRGFGTVTVDDRPLRLPCERFETAWLIRNSADDLTDVLSCVAACLSELGIRAGTAGDGQPTYPRFDLAGRWHLLRPDVKILKARNAEDALAWTSQRLRDFRLDGGRNANTEGWREIVRPYLDEHPFTAEFRAGALGLPVVYTEKSANSETNGRSATVEPVINGQPSRRASPLWLRIYSKGGTWWLRSLAFNAVWLPKAGASLRVKATKGVSRPAQPVTPPTPDTIRSELERWFSYVADQGSE